jgi:hypothetical protein
MLTASAAAQAQNCPAHPYTLTNGTTADATQVMADFDNLRNCIIATPSVAGMRGAIGGLGLSNDGGNPNTVLDIAAGSATDSTAAYVMVLGSAYTKSSNSWAVGSGNGALDTGAFTTSTWYHVYLIARSDTGVVDILFSTSASAPTMPASYNYKRRVGSFRTDGSAHILAFSQNGDEFLWGTPASDINGVALGTTATLYALTVPPAIKVTARIRGYFFSSLANTGILITSPGEASVAAGATNGNFSAFSTPGSQDVAFPIDVRTNISQQIRMISNQSSTTIYEVTYGWIDTRGRNQ